MTRPAHRRCDVCRCDVCRCVTSRYSHTQNAGPFSIEFWTTDPANGEVLRRNGAETYCTAHAPEPIRTET